jgi:tripartite-type tricarboxylate transporter receptor subunit TctC
MTTLDGWSEDLVAGHIDLAFGGGDSLPLMQAGSIAAYAVASDTCVAIAPDIPSLAPCTRNI